MPGVDRELVGPLGAVEVALILTKYSEIDPALRADWRCSCRVIAASWGAASGGFNGVVRAMTPVSPHTPKSADASMSEALAGILGIGQGRGPVCGPADERAQRAVGAVAQLGEGVGGVRMLLDQGGVE
jgi:hypothetical protein